MTVLGGELDERYEVLEKVRVGGMGAIYKVRHRLLDEVRVIKTLRRPTPSGEAAERFLMEAKAATRLRHPNVANVYDFALGVEGHAYIIMEYIAGWNLQEILRGYGPPPLALTIEIAHQALRALAYLHRLKIIHRDISPDNLMLTRDVDGNPLVKLIDLGIAKTLEEDPEKRIGTGVFVGKPRYSSPERFDGGSSDARSDLYSFGVVLYELLTGLCPVTGNQTAAFIAGHLFVPPRDFDETDPDGRVPDDLRALVLKALAKAPEDRMESAEEFLWHLTIIQDRYPLGADTGSELWHLRRPARQPELAELSPTPMAVTTTGETPLAIPYSMMQALASRTAPPPKPLPPEEEETREREATTVRLMPPLRRPPRLDDTPDGREARHPARVSPLAAAPPVKPPAPPAPAGRPSDAWDLRPLQTVNRLEARQPPPPRPELVRPVPWRLLSWTRGPLAAGVVASGLLLAGLWVAPHPPWLTGATGATPRPAPVPAAVEVSAQAAQAMPAAGPPAETVQLASSGRRALPPMRPGDLIRRGEPGVQGPEVRIFPVYSYPPAARGSGRRPKVRVEVLVDERGRVIETRIPEGDHPGAEFAAAAREAAKNAQFLPPLRDKIPGKMWTELLFSFAE